MVASSSQTSKRAASCIKNDLDHLIERHRHELAACVDAWLAVQEPSSVTIQTRRRDDGEEGVEIESMDLPGQPTPRKETPSAEGQATKAKVPLESWVAVAPAPEQDKASNGGDTHDYDKAGCKDPSRSESRKTHKRSLHKIFNAEGAKHTGFERMISSKLYQATSAFLILSNSVFIGWQTQHMAELTRDMARRDPPQEAVTPDAFVVVGSIFNVLFAIELLLRWYAEGCLKFFMNEDKYWNALDVVVVATGVLDLCFEIWSLAGNSSGGAFILGELTILRILRVCRVIRVIRFIRVMRFFRELRMMIFSILGSFKSLVWVGLVLGMMFYLFGISFTLAVTSHLKNPEMYNDPKNEDLLRYFGTLDSSIASLFMAMSGGVDWGDLYYEVLKLSWQYRYIFLMYITLAIFAVVNVVTGVFVDCAMQSNKADKEVVVHEEVQDKKQRLEELREVFVQLDKDGSGLMRLEEFQAQLHNELVTAYFAAMKLNISDAKNLFTLLDFDQSNAITIDEFISGCFELQGEATAIDTKIMHCEVKFLKEAVTKLSQNVVDLKGIVEVNSEHR